MNYSKIFLISLISITTIFYAKVQAPPFQKNQIIEKQINIWLHNHFSPKFHNIYYTPELFNQVKRHLIVKGYIQYMPHKDLKNMVKDEVVFLKKKKHHTEKWIRKHKIAIATTIKDFRKNNAQADSQHILNYLNSCNNKVCKSLQRALKDPDFLPELIKKDVKRIIKETQK